jgi:Fur family transcriptional regulator, zinc uptake regulator
MAVSESEIAAQLHRAEEVCEHHGVRFTGLRRQVLSLIVSADGPVGAYGLLARLKETHKGAAPPTVYRALDFLVSQGLIHRVERLNAFIVGRYPQPVQLLVCRGCGTVAELEDRAIVRAIERATVCKGFQPKLGTLEIEGTCSRCASLSS